MAKKYKGHGDVFIAFMDVLETIAIKNFHLFDEYCIKKARILRTTSPIMLDSDNLKSKNNSEFSKKDEKLMII